MSDIGNERRVEGLAPRRQLDLSRLQRKNREQPAGESADATPQPSPTTPAVAEEQAPIREPAGKTTAGPTASTPRRRTNAQRDVPATAPATAEETTRISFYVPEELSRRAKAAFRATAFQAGDRTWSAFLVRALESEVNRRESEFNGGDRFEDSGENLPAGRPLA